MKRIFFILSGMIVFGGICIGLTWLLGAFLGPLYQGEDESTRNFKIFLGFFVFSLIAGGLISDKIFKRKSK